MPTPRGHLPLTESLRDFTALFKRPRLEAGIDRFPTPADLEELEISRHDGAIYSVNQVAEEFGVDPRVILRLAETGLVNLRGGTPGHRHYILGYDLRRLGWVLPLYLLLGLSLPEVGDLVGTYDSSGNPQQGVLHDSQRAEAALQALLARTDHYIRSLLRLRRRILRYLPPQGPSAWEGLEDLLGLVGKEDEEDDADPADRAYAAPDRAGV